jgi:manganese transport protein
MNENCDVPSLPEVYRSIKIPTQSSFWKKMLAYAGPGYLVAVGYMDPGNWATDIAGGSKFGYTLLSVIFLSNLMAILLQSLCVRYNLYLHSSIVQTRDWESTSQKRWEAIKFGTIDSTLALFFALFINSAILIVAAAVFHFSGYQEVAEIQDAYRLLSPLLGVAGASAIFGLALLASGQSSTLTATLAGQIVMEGFLRLRLPSWLRRLATRLLAIVPALIVIIFFGERSTGSLLIFSQVILSLHLSFAVIPLIMFTSDRRLMGEFVNPFWLKVISGAVATIIVSLNLWLLLQTFLGWLNL